MPKKNKKVYNVAFVGNPNVGKSSLINCMSKKHHLSVGNWSGVTVEKAEVKINHNKKQFIITDLPGILDLNSKTLEEKITINNILSSKYDLFVNVIDATNLDRSLNLTLLLKELNVPFIILMNLVDELEDNGNNLRLNKIEKILNTKIVKVSAKKRYNIEEAISTIINECEALEVSEHKNKNFFLYDQILENLQINIYNNLKEQGFEHTFTINPSDIVNKFAAIRLLENDSHFEAHVTMENLNFGYIKGILKEFEIAESESTKHYLRSKRNHYKNNLISSLNKETLNTKRAKRTLKIDKILLHKWFGIPIMLAIFLLSFVFVFNISTPFKNWIDEFINSFIAGGVSQIHGLPAWFQSFLIDGILGGVGTIITFVPVIFVLFIWINLLRESGYMSRIGFLLSRLFNSIGLSGKSLVPLVLGFGCNVTSVYATRTITNLNKRKSTALVSPFMSCSARLPIYALFAAAFFQSSASLVIFAMYVLGIFIAIFVGIILKSIYKTARDDDENIDELPHYNLPNMFIVLKSSSINIRGFLKKAATLILGFSILIWILTYFPYGNTGTNAQHSILAVFSHYLAYIFIPLGFGHVWQLVAAILPAIAAKEVTVAVLGVFSNTGTGPDIVNFKTLMIDFGWSFVDMFKGLLPNNWFSTFSSGSDSSSRISSWFQQQQSIYPRLPLYAFTYMVFMLLTIPCITTLVALRQEFGYKTMWLSVGLGLAVPYIVCLIIFWVGYGLFPLHALAPPKLFNLNKSFLTI